MHFIVGAFWDHFHLEIVGFLAILGEACVRENSQIAFLSPFGFLPRFVPAPQALITTQRPKQLPTERGIVVGARNGNYRGEISHLAHIIHDITNDITNDDKKLERNWIKHIKIKKRKRDPEPKTKQHTSAESPPEDVELQEIQQPPALETETAETVESKKKPTPTYAQIATWGPLTWLAIAGFVLFVILLILSGILHDGMGLVSTLLLGLLSPLLHLGSFSWVELALFQYKRLDLPPSNVVVKYPKGIFLYVECEDEEVARQLYFEPEECQYRFKKVKIYQYIGLFGTFMLMAAVVTLANAGTKFQFSFAIVYVALNAAYWYVASLPVESHWDLGKTFEWTHVRTVRTENFTQALWTMIAISGTIDWLNISDIAPVNSPWKKWKDEAAKHMGPPVEFNKKNEMTQPDWDCQTALTNFLRQVDANVAPETPGTATSEIMRIPSQENRDFEADMFEQRILPAAGK